MFVTKTELLGLWSSLECPKHIKLNKNWFHNYFASSDPHPQVYTAVKFNVTPQLKVSIEKFNFYEVKLEVSFENVNFYEAKLKVSFENCNCCETKLKVMYEKFNFYEVKLKVSVEKFNFYEVKLKVSFETTNFLRGKVEGQLWKN